MLQGHALMSVIGIQGQRMLYNTKPGLTTQVGKQDMLTWTSVLQLYHSDS